MVGANVGKVTADLGVKRNVSLQQLPSRGAASAQPGGGGASESCHVPGRGCKEPIYVDWILLFVPGSG